MRKHIGQSPAAPWASKGTTVTSPSNELTLPIVNVFRRGFGVLRGHSDGPFPNLKVQAWSITQETNVCSIAQQQLRNHIDQSRPRSGQLLRLRCYLLRRRHWQRSRAEADRGMTAMLEARTCGRYQGDSHCALTCVPGAAYSSSTFHGAFVMVTTALQSVSFSHLSDNQKNCMAH